MAGLETFLFVILGILILVVFILLLQHFHLNKLIAFGKVQEARHVPPNDQVLNYIKGAKDAGLGYHEIRKNLLHAGWKKETVDTAFRKL